MILKIKNSEIQDLATNGKVYSRGRQYYVTGNIRSMTYDPEDQRYDFVIAGSRGHVYHPFIKINAAQRPVQVSCDCKAFTTYAGCCKHLVAALIMASEEDTDHKLALAAKPAVGTPTSLLMSSAFSPATLEGGPSAGTSTRRYAGLSSDSDPTSGISSEDMSVVPDIDEPSSSSGPSSQHSHGLPYSSAHLSSFDPFEEDLFSDSFDADSFDGITDTDEIAPAGYDFTIDRFRRSLHYKAAREETLRLLHKIQATVNQDKKLFNHIGDEDGSDLSTAPIPEAELRLEATLLLPSFSSDTAKLRVRIGHANKLYKVKKLEELIGAVLQGHPIHFGKFLNFMPIFHYFDPPSRALLDWMTAHYLNNREKTSYSWQSVQSFFQGDAFLLNSARLKELLELYLENDHTPELLFRLPETRGRSSSFRDKDRAADLEVVRGWPPVRFCLEAITDPEETALYTGGEQGSNGVYTINPRTIDLRTGKTIKRSKPLSICQASSWSREGCDIRLYAPDASILLFKNKLYLTPAHDRLQRELFATLSGESKQDRLRFLDRDVAHLMNLIYREMEEKDYLALDPDLQDHLVKEELTASLYLDTAGKGLSCRVLFKYGDQEIDPHPAADHDDSFAGSSIWSIRDHRKEMEILQLLGEAGFSEHSLQAHRTAEQRNRPRNAYYLHGDDKVFRFVSTILPQLSQLAEIYHTPAVAAYKVRSLPSLRGHFSLDRQTDLLSLDIEGDDELDEELILTILKAYREKRHYVRLKDGSFMDLLPPDADLDASAEHQASAASLADDQTSVDDQASVDDQTSTDDPASSDDSLIGLDLLDKLTSWGASLDSLHMTMPSYRALPLARLLETGTDDKALASLFTMDGDLHMMVDEVSRPDLLGFTLPPTITADLRPYQETGFKWFCTLDHYGFGGILADEMGLGKTLQTLSYIAYAKERLKLPAIVIAPTSIIYNWQDEARRFCPSLKTAVLAGPKPDRLTILQDIASYDLLILSYAVARQDIKELSKISFGVCILDEAQAIKNPLTQTARTVKRLRSLRRFALTGTPIENALYELWSIFDFIMPGYLLGHQAFQTSYEAPIAKGDTGALTTLHHLTTPFILRRVKKDVLRELPDKVETQMLCEMTDSQKLLYQSYLQSARASIQELLQDGSPGTHRIEILSLLTRLRQLCCHPSLFIENYDDDSGKLAALDDLLDNLFEEDHRVLLFSQFTGMLDIIRKQQEKKGRDMFYIDGSISAQDRMDQVDRFNRGEKKLFLISLKAGGTGLNLTGADAVILYDPWWNPAIEQQATDRAHRIGQKNMVQIFRLITRGSIEEKIDHLKQQKSALIDSIIRPTDNPLSKLSHEELMSLFE